MEHSTVQYPIYHNNQCYVWWHVTNVGMFWNCKEHLEKCNALTVTVNDTQLFTVIWTHLVSFEQNLFTFFLKLVILYQTIFITLRSLQLYLLFFRNYHCYPHRGPCLTAALWPGLWDYTRQGAILFTLVSLDMCSYHRFYPWISGTHPELHVHLSLFIPEAGEIWLSILVWSWNNT